MSWMFEVMACHWFHTKPLLKHQAISNHSADKMIRYSLYWTSFVLKYYIHITLGNKIIFWQNIPSCLKVYRTFNNPHWNFNQNVKLWYKTKKYIYSGPKMFIMIFLSIKSIWFFLKWYLFCKIEVSIPRFTNLVSSLCDKALIFALGCMFPCLRFLKDPFYVCCVLDNKVLTFLHTPLMMLAWFTEWSLEENWSPLCHRLWDTTGQPPGTFHLA